MQGINPCINQMQNLVVNPSLMIDMNSVRWHCLTPLNWKLSPWWNNISLCFTLLPSWNSLIDSNVFQCHFSQLSKASYFIKPHDAPEVPARIARKFTCSLAVSDRHSQRISKVWTGIYWVELGKDLVKLLTDMVSKGRWRGGFVHDVGTTTSALAELWRVRTWPELVCELGLWQVLIGVDCETYHSMDSNKTGQNEVIITKAFPVMIGLSLFNVLIGAAFLA